MRIVSSRFLAITTLTLLAMPQLTWAWTKDYSYEHKMGDNDSRNLAKEAAIEQIKLKAAQEAGTYIQGTTTLTNGQLEETITQIGASIVKVVVQSDKISVNDAGNQLLTITANATVDESIMQERIKALQEDANKAKLLQQLASENEKLRTEMSTLAKQRAQELDSDKLAVIIARETTLRKDIVANINSTEQAFTSVVSAIDIANQEALARKNEFDKIESEWELKFFQPLLKPKIIKAEVADMKLSDDGKYYTGKIIIEWQNDPNKEIEQFLCQQDNNMCHLKGGGWLTFSLPPSLNHHHLPRFSHMIGKNGHHSGHGFYVYALKASLGDTIKLIHETIRNANLTPSERSAVRTCRGYKGSEKQDDIQKICRGLRINNGIQSITYEFQIPVYAMKINPLLKVEVLSPKQYTPRFSEVIDECYWPKCTRE